MANFEDMVVLDEPMIALPRADDITALAPPPVVQSPLVEVEAGPMPVVSPTPSVPRDLREFLRALSPAFLRYPWGERLVGVFGLLGDVVRQGAMLAVASRASVGTAYLGDTRELLAQERMLPRLPGESAPDWQARLEDAWRIWERAGSEEGVLEQLAHLGISQAYPRLNREVDFDGHPERWSRLWLIAWAHPWREEGTWGDGQIWGDSGTWGSSASVEQVDAARRIVRAMKPGEMLVERIAVAFAGAHGGEVPTRADAIVEFDAHDWETSNVFTLVNNYQTVEIAGHPFDVTSRSTSTAPGVAHVRIEARSQSGVTDAWARAPGPTTLTAVGLDSTLLTNVMLVGSGIVVTPGTTGGALPAGKWNDLETQATAPYAFWAV